MSNQICLRIFPYLAIYFIVIALAGCEENTYVTNPEVEWPPDVDSPLHIPGSISLTTQSEVDALRGVVSPLGASWTHGP